ncbi:MAG: hypothetical protein GY756_05215, partial [bacterium]|nr:hypothetical protein [bacterium]
MKKFLLLSISLITVFSSHIVLGNWLYQSNVGLDVSFNQTNWYSSSNKKENCKKRWNKIFDSGFKLVRIYHFINPYYLNPSNALLPTNSNGADIIG